jgi:hypothetical protein
MAYTIGERKISRRFYRMENLDNALDHGLRANHENRWVFEISWETCNKGEIHVFGLLVAASYSYFLKQLEESTLLSDPRLKCRQMNLEISTS